MDCSPPGSPVHEVFQVRALEISGWRNVHQPREPKGRNTFRRLINSGAKRHETERNTLHLVKRPGPARHVR